MMPRFGHRYTAEDDARVLAATTPAALAKLAPELGRTVGALNTRRTLLRAGTTSMQIHRHRVEEDAVVPPKTPKPAVFARPSWFEEDLGNLAVMKH